jgi:hypothetical protein
MPDFILNGQGFGTVAQALLANDFDVGAMRPFVGENNLPYVTMTMNGKPKTVLAYNAPATLRFAEWRMIDRRGNGRGLHHSTTLVR